MLHYIKISFGLLFLLLNHSLLAITSTQAGDWEDNNTWGGSPYPGTTSGSNLRMDEDVKIVDDVVKLTKSLEWGQNDSYTLTIAGSSNDAVTVINGDIIGQTNSNVKIIVTKGALIISGNLTINNKLELDVKNGGVLVVTGDLDINNAVNVDILSDGNIIVDGDIDTQGFNGNLKGNIASFGDINMGVTLQSGDQINFFGDNTVNITNDQRNDSSGDGTTQVYADTYPEACKYSLSCLAICGTCNYNHPLPVNWLYTKAELLEYGVQISWATASEENNSFFTVQKSTDLNNWTNIETIEGKGNSYSVSKYASIDYDVDLGITYYRIAQTDFDGTETYSELLYINNSNTPLDLVSIHPNPNNGTFTIIGIDEDYELSISSEQGQTVDFETNFNGQLIEVNTNNSLSGVYIARITTSTKTYIQKLVIK